MSAHLRLTLFWTSLLSLILPLTSPAGGNVTELVLPEGGTRAATVVWTVSAQASEPERASEEERRHGWDQSVRRISSRNEVKMPAFYVKAAGPAPGNLKAGSFATALLATAWQMPSPLNYDGFVVCGEMNAAGLVTSSPAVRKAIASFAVNPVPGVTMLLIPDDCVDTVRQTVAQGYLTYVTDCVVWTTSEYLETYDFFQKKAAAVRLAAREYLSRRSLILQRRDNWQLTRGPALRFAESLVDDGDDVAELAGVSASGGVTPLTLMLYDLPVYASPVPAAMEDAGVTEGLRNFVSGFRGDMTYYSRLRSLSPRFSAGRTAVGFGLGTPDRTLEGARDITYQFVRLSKDFRFRVTATFTFNEPGLKDVPLFRGGGVQEFDLFHCPMELQTQALVSTLDRAGIFNMTGKAGQAPDRRTIPAPVAVAGKWTKNFIDLRDVHDPGSWDAELSFLLWWDAAGLISIPKSGPAGSKVQWFGRELTKEAAGRQGHVPGRWWDVILNDRQKLPPPGTAATGYSFDGYLFPETTPELLATFTRGAMGCILRVSEFTGNSFSGFHYLPLISATADGTIEFVSDGKIQSAKLEPFDRSDAPLPGRKDLKLKSWKLVPARQAVRGNFKGELRIIGTADTSRDPDGLRLFWIDSRPALK